MSASMAVTESRWQRLLVPGFVIRSVLVGATFSTGREVTEFFLRYGGFAALIGIIVTTVIYSGACMIAFELARRFRVLDYKNFCKVYMGRWWPLYEIGFLFGVLLTLSTIAAAASEFGGDSLGLSKTVTSMSLMGAIAVLVALGSRRLERIMSLWSIFFYSAYAILLVCAAMSFMHAIGAKLQPAPVPADAIASAAIYAGFNCSILPIVIFVARHLHTRSDALVAGALAGPLVMAAGFALLFILLPFTPGIVDVPVPITQVLKGLSMPWLMVLIRVAILGELALNGTGLLHGVNERIANGLESRGRKLTGPMRAGVALGAIAFSVFLAAKVGLIDLVAEGFRYGAYLFLVIMVLPLLTRGLWMVLPRAR
ncbi:MAG: hypothetical protein JSR66_02205 [Proteobacteria bacterium]|nr:hypothetical protein [Pseudomonadota bacterium]